MRAAEDKNPLIIDATNSILSTYDSIFVIRKKQNKFMVYNK